ncbi:nucleoside hydrolase [Actinoplanes couchii]|uniref:Ribosylpyrimidine nucleosidase n=1 Tax=Actinoplanes couchii TaxID=403638 RepID=A0ABQ3X7P9_9ACTN|nr:nucleoside hydrolase [Actinoplanes couchii]MDR6320439.1 purine nucleosidase [Actinoplanes couchii]GID54549.1 ribosylpyrimidine nucleosidase [Actinoplanes couchii]
MRKIIVDCDPGHDDAFALMLAWGNPTVDLIGVTTVAGNQSISKVTRNALSVAGVCGITGVPFARGLHRPLVRPPGTAASVHGDSGLDGPVLPEPALELDGRHAVDLIIDLVMTHPPGSVTLVPTGPLSNIATAAVKEPAIVSRVHEVVLMGGAIRGGNRTPVAEFNIAVDPEAASIVFQQPWKVTMVGLDVTHTALATPEVCARIEELGTVPSRFFGEVLRFFTQAYLNDQGFAAPPVHDPCAVAYVIDPSLLTVRAAPVDVELHGRLTTGMTVVDMRGEAPPGCTTHVATGIDVARFWDLVLDALRRIG